MTIADCPREHDLLDVLATDRWPERCDDELRRHVSGCESCRDLVATLGPLAEAWSLSRAEAHLPSSGMVWWRAHMRARQEAAQAAARPATVAQAVGMVIALAAVCAGLFVLSPWLAASAATSLASGRQVLGLDASVPGSAMQGWVVTGIAAAALLAVTFAVYLVVSED